MKILILSLIQPNRPPALLNVVSGFVFCSFWSTRPTTVPSDSDHYFHTECPSVRLSVPKLQNQATITAGWDCEQAEWIIDDFCLVLINFKGCLLHLELQFRSQMHSRATCILFDSKSFPIFASLGLLRRRAANVNTIAYKLIL